MNIVFTSHAEDRINIRKITKEEVIEAIFYPEKITKKYEKYYFTKKLQKGTIEVCCERTERDIKIITVYWV